MADAIILTFPQRLTTGILFALFSLCVIDIRANWRAFLDGDRGDSERTLEHLEDELLELTEYERKDACDEMTVIIAQLSRLKMRMLDRV